MANRFWVGGTGPWNNSSTANWAATSGGASGASAPVDGDFVTFDALSGGGTVTLGANVAATSLTLTNGTQQFSNAGGWTITLSNNGTFLANGTGITLAHPVLVISSYSASNSRVFAGAAVTEANAWSCQITAGSGTVSVTGSVRDVTFSGSYTGTFQNSTRTIYGNLTLIAGQAAPQAGTSTTTFGATSGTKTITTAGQTLDFPLNFNGAGGTWQLADNLTIGSTRIFQLTNGTFNANDKNVSIGSFGMGAGTKTLTLGTGTWTCAGAWNANGNVANLTVTASSGTISMTSAGAVSFSGGAKTWPTINIGGAGPITIAQDNTFANITNTVQPCTVRLTAGSVQTFTSFSLSGTSGNLVTLDSSSAGSAASVSKPDGVVTVAYLSLKDSTATGGALWNAIYSASVSGVTGWNVYANGLPVPGDPGLGGSIQSFLNYGRI